MFSSLKTTNKQTNLHYSIACSESHPQKKPIWQKSREKKPTTTKSRKFTKNTTMPFTNGSKVRSYPLTPNFFRKLHLPKINPAYAPASLSILFCVSSSKLSCLRLYQKQQFSHYMYLYLYSNMQPQV